MRRLLILGFVFAAVIAVYCAMVYGSSSGSNLTNNVGKTNRNGGAGCGAGGCHNGANGSITTTLSGPKTLAANGTATYTINAHFTTASAYNVGIDVASADNALTVVDSSTQIPGSNEVTHKAPLRQISGNNASYTFNFTMPNAATCCAAHTLYGVAVVSFQGWAHAQDFNVYVAPTAPSSVAASNITQSSVTLNWSGGNGGEYRALYKV